ncbi:DGQHR domain-containing protein [Planomicrobium okeanokoites]|uniref:DGQHR domain-containing protein n=1 Tax=Planomicrobium okeanokoites TaxID=244 RepID=UPI0009FB95D5|nr:DNA sulfur modification protein DndB [Planomicrobium okeanokoites]
MALIVPAIKGKMGNTNFYESKMNVRELISSVRRAHELDEWDAMPADERMQREVIKKRVEKELAPYIANQADRFFGSLIILVYKGEVEFEGLKDLNIKVNAGYRAAAKDLGFLTIDGGSLIVLDGQHRHLALEKVYKGEVEGEFASDVPNDEVTLIIIEHEHDIKTRRIFNKVNRYAKSTSKNENILTSEDDSYSIVARKLLHAGAPLDNNIVNFTSNTIAPRSVQLTTLSVVYETVKLILAHENKYPDIHLRPSDEELEEYYDISERYWRVLMEQLEPYKKASMDPMELPDMRLEDSQFSLLLKPAAQIAFFKGLIIATERGLSFEEAVKRANKITWSMTSPVWTDIIIRKNGTIDPKTDARDRTADLVAYLIAKDKMNNEEIEHLTEIYRRVRGNDNEKLPQFFADRTGN